MDTQSLIATLTWLLVSVGSGLVLSLIWFARRIVAQLDRLEALFTTETTNLDKRVTRIEDWREAVSPMLKHGPRGAE